MTKTPHRSRKLARPLALDNGTKLTTQADTRTTLLLAESSATI